MSVDDFEAAQAVKTSGGKAALGKIADLLSRSGIDPDEIERVREISVREWQGMYKDDEGEAHVVDMEGAMVKLVPTWADGPKWPVVQQAAPATIKPRKAVRPVSESGTQTAVILPDPQIGFRRLADGTLEPFHDNRAMDIGLQIVNEVNPDLIVNLGDFLDFAVLSSKFVRDPSFSETTQAAVDTAYKFLVDQKQACSEGTEIILFEGNHDLRLPLYVVENAKEAFGLKRADSPDTWPVMSVPFLLRLDELDVEYVDGYPAGSYWINDNLVCIHGARASSVTGKTASLVVDDERVSIIYGHIHRIEEVLRTRNTRNGPKFSSASSPGCLCRIDGKVPSTKSAKITPHKPLPPRYEDWQQGVAVVTYQPGNGWFDTETIKIFEGVATYRGKRYTSRVDLMGEAA